MTAVSNLAFYHELLQQLNDEENNYNEALKADVEFSILKEIKLRIQQIKEKLEEMKIIGNENSLENFQ